MYDLLKTWAELQVGDRKTKKEFDTMMEEYEIHMKNNRYTLPSKIPEIIDTLRFGQKEKEDLQILDLCCGTGLVGLELFNHGINNVDGVDFSDNINIAKERGYNEIYQHNLKELPSIKKYYDVVTMIGSLTYFNEYERDILIKIKTFLNFKYLIVSHRSDMIDDKFMNLFHDKADLFRVVKIFQKLPYLPRSPHYKDITASIFVLEKR